MSSIETSDESKAEAKRKILNRFRRAHGQLGAMIDAFEQDAPCREIVHQLAAVSKALDRAGYLVISRALTDCLMNPESGTEDPDELEELFLRLA
ncbi:metal-sensitive transcriptional regulator [Flaviflexus huanghaiensis]|uniref:metal-sensitive transcriptional regulator n=1 Tax=Flaviflexus huanghaiensis TaxID=1111473 RepID=UPI0015FC243B|nr:metal-sensitive transcriptional regulator [Flaviflexus huanghaiensis]